MAVVECWNQSSGRVASLTDEQIHSLTKKSSGLRYSCGLVGLLQQEPARVERRSPTAPSDGRESDTRLNSSRCRVTFATVRREFDWWRGRDLTPPPPGYDPDGSTRWQRVPGRLPRHPA
jgi:hypothetical protein